MGLLKHEYNTKFQSLYKLILEASFGHISKLILSKYIKCYTFKLLPNYSQVRLNIFDS